MGKNKKSDNRFQYSKIWKECLRVSEKINESSDLILILAEQKKSRIMQHFQFVFDPSLMDPSSICSFVHEKTGKQNSFLRPSRLASRI